MTKETTSALAELPMSPRQVLIAALCVLLMAIDGFDVLSISFAAPGVAREWGVDRGALGVVLSLELIAMAVGSLTLGPLADRMGRRPVILLCLCIVASGMLATASVNNILALSLCRLITGLGIGGMLPSISVMAAEFSSRRRRDLTVALVVAGYPLGAVVGGSVAALLLAHYDWRSVFVFGASVSFACLPLVWMFMPESIEHLAQRRPPDALVRINKTLQRFGHPTLSALPTLSVATRTSIGQLFTPALLLTTLLLTGAYFGHIMTSYFILKWGAKIVVDMGFAASLAGKVLVWGNLGGLIGCLLLGILTLKIRVKWLVVGAMFLSFLAVAAFGQGATSIAQLSLAAAVAGFFTQASIVGLYAIVVQSFPTEVRASGFGFVIGAGRGGAALSPIVAGLMFQADQSLATVATTMALGSILGLVLLVLQIGRSEKALVSQHASSAS